MLQSMWIHKVNIEYRNPKKIIMTKFFNVKNFEFRILGIEKLKFVSRFDIRASKLIIKEVNDGNR